MILTEYFTLTICHQNVVLTKFKFLCPNLIIGFDLITSLTHQSDHNHTPHKPILISGNLTNPITALTCLVAFSSRSCASLVQSSPVQSSLVQSSPNLARKSQPKLHHHHVRLVILLIFIGKSLGNRPHFWPPLHSLHSISYLINPSAEFLSLQLLIPPSRGNPGTLVDDEWAREAPTRKTLQSEFTLVLGKISEKDPTKNSSLAPPQSLFTGPRDTSE
ncbi:hypothetical protein CROQUDRAFT_95296 [Cronartium quercuum f. sp. fusiforme G11]|uniref:Uncharacterized protein n=1 Tax=Cronartium quercuum f. sp. fusiforme G11 TaxID=708437 RepID=A0A9P6NEM3_9BASI|nr:hypothetical protein CROQUDRAFT_95296 [Cronartium quercuum f. sp. fusiforme G11]